MRLKPKQQSEHCRIDATDERSESSSHSALRKVPVRKDHSALLLLAVLAIGLLVPNLFAQANPPSASSNRFLFIIDTSSSMKRHAADVLSIVGGIIGNGANGEMHPGDSVGLWTFNQEVYSDLPAQTLTADNRDQIGARTLDYLSRRHYTKSSHLDKALADMRDVIRESDIITVFIVSNGREKMVGTPFDSQINALYKQDLADMKHEPRAIVTVLQAKSGKIIRFTVNALPWPVVIPELPIPIQSAKTPAESKPATSAQTEVAQAKAPAPQKPVPTAPPLILKGPPHPAPSAPVAAATNVPAAPPAVAPTPIPTSTPAPVVTAPSTAPANIAPQPPVVSPSATPPANIPRPPAFTPPPPPVVLKRTIPAPTTPSTPDANNAPPSTTPAPTPAPKPVSPAPSNPVVAQAKPMPEPAPKLSDEPAPKAAVKPAAPPVTPSTATPSTNEISKRALAFVQPEVSSRPKVLLFAGLALLLVGILLIVAMVRRSRTTSGPSLISHTMGNPKGRDKTLNG